ncbi:FAD linked oxidase domain protein [Beutenbergia cavernae DSM 12333]|uniref:D-lactate dehydrogenase (cytochrome) n=1 Tax=Beutenbergia cavernae (strain ATCC BAA-8 / DSM 12333 / CCUG 43141 / JCM 11478 / NBRC 16432 / NCIMB 13614 / HKI 0122) TaxID=471853 RepID=C5BVK9_BEUC1|nr:FAD-binding and (Fe-S)-binding domain-containing protein [Beutenbergia cavernae]ACQ78449.1 FAD linked oxidase domain protein [Beutenbergia cavernae DSM 12333]
MSHASTLEVLRAVAGSDHVSDRATDRARMSHDASHYLLTPEAVVTPSSAPEVAALLATAHKHHVPLTFRSGGSSLSGQAGTDGVLVDTRRHFGGVQVLDGGARVRAEPGAVLRRVNAALAPYRRRLGPDPASEGACTIGGVVANNSSGMTSSTTATAYRTLAGLELILPSGTFLDTGSPDADRRLAALEPDLHAGLGRLRDQLRGDAALRARIEHQFSMKNTMGYGINAFLDHTAPSGILAHLVVGSEGTLGFVASATFDTLPVLPRVATALLVFASLDAAIDALPALVAAGANAVELMDATSLRVAQADPLAPALIRGLRVEHQTALLVEVAAADDAALAHVSDAVGAVIATLPLAVPGALSSDAAERAAAWHVRKGLYATVAGARPQGTTALLEDVVVPPAALGPAVRELQGLFERYDYADAVIFGHARDANLHFMITPRLDDAGQLDAYAAFTEDLVDLVLGADGSLKAEHGTGRIMAPYVRRQYGDELYAVMREVKALCDPHGILAPGVLLDDDPQAHLRHLKSVPAVDPALDRCVDCGYCEPVCPSRNTTTTPRQRIALLREIAVAPPRLRDELERDYAYEAVQTCAADSLCVVACPVNIDTGLAMKARRAQGLPAPAQRAGAVAADHWGVGLGAARAGLGVASVVPGPVLSGVTTAARALLGSEWVPHADGALPGPGRPRPSAFTSRVRGERASAGRHAPHSDADPALGGEHDVVFFPACIGELFAPERDASGAPGEGATTAFLALAERAGLRVAIAEQTPDLCCGTPWASKGLTAGADLMAQKLFAALWPLTDGGRLPVVADASSCTHGIHGLASHLPEPDAERWSRVRVVDAVAYARAELLPRLGAVADERLLDRLVLHPTCASVHLGEVDDLAALGGAVAREAVVPENWGCCGFAGDRGLLHPELTRGATEAEAGTVAALGRADAYASCNRTCELGMTRATGKPYRHVLELLEEATRP